MEQICRHPQSCSYLLLQQAGAVAICSLNYYRRSRQSQILSLGDGSPTQRSGALSGLYQQPCVERLVALTTRSLRSYSDLARSSTRVSNAALASMNLSLASGCEATWSCKQASGSMSLMTHSRVDIRVQLQRLLPVRRFDFFGGGLLRHS